MLKNSIFRLLNSSIKDKLGPFKDWCNRATRSVDGCTDWYDLSFDGTVNQYEECPGNEFVRFKPGHKYEDLVQIFKNDIPYNNIKVNHKVTKISYENEMEIFCENGEKFEADIVIFTASLGVLKAQSRQIFAPKLPQNKQEAIDKIGFGTVNKIFLEFPDRIFDCDGYKFLFNDSGISYSSQDAEKDWTRFILGT